MAEHPPTRGRLRILQVVPVLAVGGLERVAQHLTLELARRGHHVAVAGRTGVEPKFGGPEIELPLRKAGIPLYHLTRPRPHPATLLRASFELARVLRRERPDVVHAHNPTGGAAASIARLLAAQPRLAIVTTYHGVQPHRVDRAARALSFGSDVVVGVGPSSTRALVEAGLPEERSATIYNAVAVSPERGRDEVRAELGVDGSELVVTVGRYMPEKNQALLIDALAELAERRPTVRGLIVGIGRLEDELRAHARERGVENVVRVIGPRNDAADVMGAADVFALSSDSEALPLAVLEAMRAGAAVVSTDVGGVGDVVRDGDTGLLVPARDRSALADAIERVLDDDDLRRRLTTHAREFVDRTCSERAMVDAYVELYSATVERRRRRFTAFRAGARRSK